MIGEIRKAITPYFDLSSGKKKFKSRPVLILANADTQDYVCLPISRVSRQQNLHPAFDIPVDPSTYPNLNLHSVSYIRTHKQTIIHYSEIGNIISDLKSEYEDLYLHVLELREEFSKDISSQALAVL